jgi:hypothetical protein
MGPGVPLDDRPTAPAPHHRPCIPRPVLRERLEGLGAVIVPEHRATQEYLAPFVKSEVEGCATPIKASGVTVD